tara:strand:- start:45 stop:350 length:306 start_codon:yes stop_codon:yes gene_type:complete
MSSKQFKPPEGKDMKPQQKVAKDYGKKNAYKYPYKTQQGDGLVIAGVRNFMKLPKTKMKEEDIFDVNGDGKPSKKDPLMKVEKNYNSKIKSQFIYNYKKRI